MTEPLKNYYTKEEYFVLQKELDYKIEYHQGRIVAMAGGSPNHNKISGNILTALNLALSDRDCLVYNSDQQISLSFDDRYVYADVTVVCGEEEFEGPNPLKLKNPVLIIEVLSKTTGKHDKTSKFQLYRKIPSFKEYLLVHADKVLVEGYYWEEQDLWRIASPYKLDESIHLHSLNIDIALKDIYKKIRGVEEGPFF